MKLHCPHCGVKGSTDDSYSGRKVKCPECKELFVVSSDMVIVSPEAPEVTEVADVSEVADVAEVQEITEEIVESAELPAESVDVPADESIPEDTSQDDNPEELDSTELEEDVPEEAVTEEDVSEEDVVEEEVTEEEVVEEDTVTLEDEIEQEPYGIEKKQCWQCGIEESSDESFVTSNGRLYCTNCVQPEGADDEAIAEEGSSESVNEAEISEAQELPEIETQPEEPVKGGAWAKLKSFFKK